MVSHRSVIFACLSAILGAAMVTSCIVNNAPEVALATETIATTETIAPVAPLPTDTPQPAPPTETPVPSATPEPTLSAADWRDFPIIPTVVSPKLKELYRAGLEAGNNPNRFSKVGDSNSVAPTFFSCFDFGDLGYVIGPYSELEATIKQFQWSFSRQSRATENGKTAYDLDTYHWYLDDICWPYESATTCEYRLWQPSIAFIALGTNDTFMKVADFDKHMRSLVEKTMERFSVVPILVTKADNLDPDGAFNHVIAQIALDYDLPLWNLWRAMQPLPNHGLQEDQVHPTAGSVSLCDFSGDDLKKYGWTMRNLTGLQTLDSVYRLLNAE